MKASLKNLILSLTVVTVLIGLVGAIWVVDPIVSRMVASVTLFILAVWMGYLADAILEIRGDWNAGTKKRYEKLLREAVEAEPFGVLTSEDLDKIFKEMK